MLWTFGIIILLVALLLIPNALYAFRQFLSNRNIVWLMVYFGFLILLAYLLIHVTTRTMDLVQKAKEVYLEPGP
jgi:hypothetical protein